MGSQAAAPPYNGLYREAPTEKGRLFSGSRDYSIKVYNKEMQYKTLPRNEKKAYIHRLAYHLFHDQYRAQTAPQRATLKQTNRNTFAENPALAGSNKRSSGDTSPKQM